MAIIFQDSMDRYAQQSDLAAVYNTSVGNIQLTSGRFGAGAMYVQAGLVSYAFFAVPGLPNEVWFGYSTNIHNIGSPQQGVLFTIIGNNGIECYVTYNQLTAQFQVCNGLNNAVIASSAPILLTSGSWHWLDIRCKLHASAGILEVWADNVQYINATGIDTAPQGSTEILTGCFGYPYSINSIGVLIDDPAVENPNVSPAIGRIGDSRIVINVPASDAGPNNGTPSTGSSHFALVDEAQWDNTDYITITNTTGQEEKYTTTALPVTPQTILAVQIAAWCEKTDAGAASIKLGVDSGGTTSLGSAKSPPTPWGIVTQLFALDPHTSAAWTESGVNAVKPILQVQ